MKKLSGLMLILLMAGCGGSGGVQPPANPVEKPADLEVVGSSGGSSKSGAGAMSEGLK